MAGCIAQHGLWRGTLSVTACCAKQAEQYILGLCSGLLYLKSRQNTHLGGLGSKDAALPKRTQALPSWLARCLSSLCLQWKGLSEMERQWTGPSWTGGSQSSLALQKASQCRALSALGSCRHLATVAGCLTAVSSAQTTSIPGIARGMCAEAAM